jgi:hypothetical protein
MSVSEGERACLVSLWRNKSVLVKVESGAGDVDRDGEEDNVSADLISPSGIALRPAVTVMSNGIS